MKTMIEKFHESEYGKNPANCVSFYLGLLCSMINDNNHQEYVDRIIRRGLIDFHNLNDLKKLNVEVKPVTKTTSKSTEKIRVNRNTHDDYVRRSYTLSEEHVRKLQLMKTFCDDTNITYNELIEKSIDLLWKHEYQDKYIQLLKTIG